MELVEDILRCAEKVWRVEYYVENYVSYIRETIKSCEKYNNIITTYENTVDAYYQMGQRNTYLMKKDSERVIRNKINLDQF